MEYKSRESHNAEKFLRKLTLYHCFSLQTGLCLSQTLMTITKHSAVTELDYFQCLNYLTMTLAKLQSRFFPSKGKK